MTKERLKSPRARLFVALDLPEQVREGLVAWQREALTDPALRPVAAEALHVTLCFLAYQPEREIERIAEAMRSVGARPVPARFKEEPVAVPRNRPRLFAVDAESEGADGAPGRALRRLEARALLPARETDVLAPCDRRPGQAVQALRLRSARAPEGPPDARRGAPRGAAGGALGAVWRRPSDALPFLLRPSGAEYVSLAELDLPPDGGGEKVIDDGREKKTASRWRVAQENGAGAKEAKAKDAALQAAVTQIERQFGQGSVMRLGDESAVQVEAISTGALSLDLALGVGGVPRGRIVEIFGPESSGKTTLVYHIIAEAQARGGICAFVDTEHAIDPIYARRIGVDVDELLVSQPDYGEQALEIVDVLVRSGAVDLVAIDSVAALTPRVELEGQMGETQVGLQARLMSQALRKLAGNLSRANTVCVFTNQIREKIGVTFGSPETQPGGRALKFYSSQRLDIRRIETLKEGTEAVGNRVRVKVVKNKVAAPFRQAEFDIEYGVGISNEGCLLDLALEHDLVQKSGSFFSYGELRLGQGRNNTKQYLAENPETARRDRGEALQTPWGSSGEGERQAGEPSGIGRRCDADRRRRRGGRGARAQGSLAAAWPGGPARCVRGRTRVRCGARSGRPPSWLAWLASARLCAPRRSRRRSLA